MKSFVLRFLSLSNNTKKNDQSEAHCFKWEIKCKWLKSKFQIFLSVKS